MDPLAKSSLDDLCKTSTTLLWPQFYRLNDFVDIWDEIAWRAAIITSLSPTSLSAHFEGWSKKYDVEAITFTNSKLNPFRMHSCGYTGQTKCPALREFKFDPNKLRDFLEKIKTIKEIGCDNFSESALEITQFFRGELFFYVDSLLTLVHNSSPSPGDISQIFEFFDQLIGLIVNYLLSFTKYNPEYWAASQQYPNLYLISQRAALAMMYPELAEILKLLFGVYLQRVEASWKYISFTSNPNSEKVTAINYCGSKFYSMFKKANGWEALKSMLKIEEGKPKYPLAVICKFMEPIKGLLDNGIEIEELTTAFLPQLGELLRVRLTSSTTLEDLREIESLPSGAIAKTIDVIFSKSKENYTKIKGMIEHSMLLACMQSPDINKKLQGISNLKINIGITEFMSQLKLISSQSGNTNKAHPAQASPTKPESNSNQQKKEDVKRVKNELSDQQKKLLEIGELIKESHVLELIFSSCSQPPVLKKSSEIIMLAMKSGAFTTKHMETIWNNIYVSPHSSSAIVNSSQSSGNSIDLSMRQAIFETLGEMANYATYPILEVMFKCIKSVPITLITQPLIVFIREYTINVALNINKREKEHEQMNKLKLNSSKKNQSASGQVADDAPVASDQDHTKMKLVDFDIFWQILQQVPKIVSCQQLKPGETTLLISTLIQSIGAIVEGKPEIMLSYLDSCYSAMKEENEIIIIMIKTFDYLYKKFIKNSKLYISRAQQNAKEGNKDIGILTARFTDLLKQHDFYWKICDSLIKYLTEVRNTVKNDSNISKIMERVFKTGICHEEILTGYFTFLESLSMMSNFELNLQERQIADLWKHFVREPCCIGEQNLFYIHCMKNNQSDDYSSNSASKISSKASEPPQYIFLSDANANILLNNFFANESAFPQMMKITLLGFNCYKAYFIRCNGKKGKLTQYPQLKVEKLEELDTLKYLWQLSIDAQEIEVKEAAIDFLIKLYSAPPIKPPSSLTELISKNCCYFIKQAITQFPLLSSKTPDQFASLTMNFLTAPQLKSLMRVIKMIQDFIFAQQANDQPIKKLENKALFKKEPRACIKFILFKNGRKANSIHTISCNENLSIAQLKYLLSYKLRTQLSRLQITLQKSKTPFNKETEKMLIKRVSNEILIIEILPPPIPLEKSPLFCIGNTKLLIDSFINIMAINEEANNEIWKIIKRTPVPYNLRGKLTTIAYDSSEPKNDNWLKILDIPTTVNCNHLILYYSWAVNKLIKESEGESLLKLFIARDIYSFLHFNILQILPAIELKLSQFRAMNYIFKCMIRINKGIEKESQEKNKAPAVVSETHKEALFSTFEFLKKFIQITDPTAKSKLADKELNMALNKAGKSGIEFILSCCSKSPAIYIPIIENKMQEFLFFIFTKSNNTHLLNTILEQIKIAIIKINDSSGISKTLFTYLFHNMIVNEALIKEMKPYNNIYYDFITKIFEEADEKGIIFESNILEQKLMDKIAVLMLNFGQYPSANFYGIIKVLEVLCRKGKKLLNFPLVPSLLTKLILFVFPKNIQECFNENDAKVANQLITNEYFIWISLKFINVIINDNYNYTLQIIKAYSAILPEVMPWRNSQPINWGIQIEEEQKGLGTQQQNLNYVGLTNPANVCYMNSLLQQLFSINLFSKALIEANVVANNLGPASEANPQKANFIDTCETVLISQLKVILGMMSAKQRKAYNASYILQLIKDVDGNNLSINEQKDVDEFLSLLMDKIEMGFKNSPAKPLVQNSFGGFFSGEIICKDCPHRSQSTEPFLSISLQIAGKKLTDSLRGFIEAESMEGKNGYNCQRCEKIVNAKKRSSILVLPNILIICLKRFTYDHVRGIRKKINDEFEFPFELSMEEYCQEKLWKQEITEKMERNPGITEESLSKEEKALLATSFPPEYYLYSLKGVILHSGTAESGHYTSLVKDTAQDKWIEFDDSRVKEFNPDMMASEAYGGVIDNIPGIEMGNIDRNHEMFIKTKNAYMLFYERHEYYHIKEIAGVIEKSRLAYNQTSAQLKEIFSKSKINKAELLINLPSELQKSLLEDNAQHALMRTYLNSNYINLISHIITEFPISISAEYKKLTHINLHDPLLLNKPDDSYMQIFSAWRFLFKFIFTALLRIKSTDKESLYKKMLPILTKCQILLSKDVGLCIWLIQSLSNPLILKEIYLDCPLPFPKFFISSLLITASWMIDKHQKKKMIKWINKKEEDILNKYIAAKAEQKLDKRQTWEFPPDQVKNPLIFILINNLVVDTLVMASVQADKKSMYAITYLLSWLGRLGPHIKKFLLTLPTLSILMDIIIQNQVSSQKKTEICGIYPLYTISYSKPSSYNFLGFQAEVTSKVAPPNSPHKSDKGTKYREKVSLKALSNEKKSKPFIYVIDLFALLFCECKSFSEDSILSAPMPELHLPHDLQKDESEIITHFYDDAFLSTLFSYGYSSISIHGIGKVMTHVAYKNPDIRATILRYVLPKLRGTELDILPVYLHSIYSIIIQGNGKDKINEEGITLMINILRELMSSKSIIQSYISFSLIIDMLLGIAIHASNELYTCIHKKENEVIMKEFFNMLLAWLKENRYPDPEKHYWIRTGSWGIRVQKEIDKAEKEGFKSYSKRRIKLLKELLRKPTPKQPKPEWHKNESIGEKFAIFSDWYSEILPNTQYDIKVNNRWYGGLVLETLGKGSGPTLFVKFSYKDKAESKEKWIKSATGKIASICSFSANDSAILNSKLRDYAGHIDAGFMEEESKKTKQNDKIRQAVKVLNLEDIFRRKVIIQWIKRLDLYAAMKEENQEV